MIIEMALFSFESSGTDIRSEGKLSGLENVDDFVTKSEDPSRLQVFLDPRMERENFNQAIFGGDKFSVLALICLLMTNKCCGERK